MSMIKGTIWNIATLLIGIKLVLLSIYKIDFIPQFDLKIVGITLVAVSVWFLISRLVFGPQP